MFQANRPFGFGGTTAFGAPAFGATTTPAFGGATTPAFGATSTPAFGAATPAFGAPATPSFGASTPAFGAPAMPAFGAAAATPFGGATTPAFGASTTPAFGASTTPGFGFSAQPATAFGATPQPSAFGATPSAFGTTPAAQPSAFGAAAPATGFGAPTSSFAFPGTNFGTPPASPFAQPQAATSTAFGQSASPFGTPAPTTATGAMFGTPSTQTGFGFGQTTASTGAFGQTAPQTQQQQQITGTGNPKFQPTVETDQTGTMNHQVISAMPAYNKKSFEELRWEDYQAGKKNATVAATILASQAPASASPFASQTTSSPFGTSTTTASSSYNMFNPAPSTPSNPFGATTTTTTTATTPSAFNFGQSTQPAPTSNIFGATPASTFPSFSAAPATSNPPFGTTLPASTPPAFGFSTTTTAPATTSTPFGTSTTASPFGSATSAAFSSFLSPQASTTSPFGATAPPASNPFGATSLAGTQSSLFSATTPSFGQSTSFLSSTTPSNPFASTNTPNLGTAPSLFNPPTISQPSIFNTYSTAQPQNSFISSGQIGITPTFSALPTTSIASSPVAAPLPVFSLPTSSTSTPTPISAQSSSAAPNAIPTLTFTRTPSTPQRNTYVSSYPRSLPSRSGSLVRIKDSPSYGGRLFSEDKVVSPSGIHITPENLSLRSSTPSKPRVDIKRLNLQPYETEKKQQLQQQQLKLQQQPTEPPTPIPIQIPNNSIPIPSLLQTPLSVTQPSSPMHTPTNPLPHVANDAPTLRNPNYYTKPTMDFLKEMSSDELSRIEDFTVGCEELGYVRWHGKTDVRGLNLDDVVLFEKKAVTVYPEQGIYPKPPVGEGLNRPATITLFRVFPKKLETADKYVQMIVSTTKKFEGKLLCYDPVKGIWEFEVHHFSRYGIMDDEDESEHEREGKVVTATDTITTSTATSASVDKPLTTEERAPMRDTITQPKALIFKAPQDSFLALPPPASHQPPTHRQHTPASHTTLDAKSAGRNRLSHMSMRGIMFTEEEPEAQPMVVDHHSIRQSQLTGGRKGKNVITTSTSTAITTTTTTTTTTADSIPFPPSFIAREAERIKSPSPQQPQRTVVRSPVPIFTPIPHEEEAELIVRAPQLRLKAMALSHSVVAGASDRASHSQDMSLLMGRSFRVGWGPNGRLLRASNSLGVLTLSSPPISTRNSAAAASSTSTTASTNLLSSSPPIAAPHVYTDRYLLELLQTHLYHSTPQYGPHFVLKDLDANIQANIKICDPSNDFNSNNTNEKDHYQQHLHLVWTLVYALWGKIADTVPTENGKAITSSPTTSHNSNNNTTNASTSSIDSNERSLSTHMLRKLLVSKWLSQALLGPIEESVKTAKSNGNTILAILHHLTGRQISPAVSLAQRSRNYRLAVLLTQTWTTPLQLVGTQIEQWEVSNASRYIDPQLLDVYKLLAGDVEFVAKDIPRICEDWLQCFALHFWYKHVPSTPIPTVLATYDAAVAKACATAPYPPYQTNQKRTPRPSLTSLNATPQDTLYRLLQLYSATSPHLPLPDESEVSVDAMATAPYYVAPPTSSLPVGLLLSAVDPANLTRDPMDFSLAWHLYTVLRVVPTLSSVIDLSIPHRLHTSYAAQLEMSGQWQWAIYVLLHIDFSSYKTVNGEWGFASGRRAAVASILERHAAEITERDYHFLTQQLRVPASWVDEAVGRYLIYDRQYSAGVQRLLRAGEWNEAHHAILEHIVPSVLVPSGKAVTATTTEMQELVHMLGTLQTNHSLLVDPLWSTGGHIYLSYFTLHRKLGTLNIGDDDSSGGARGGIVKNSQVLIQEMANIYTLSDLVAQWEQVRATPQQKQLQLNIRTYMCVSMIATYVGYLLLALAHTHRDPSLPLHLHALPIPPDVRADIMEDYVHTIVYNV